MSARLPGTGLALLLGAALACTGDPEPRAERGAARATSVEAPRPATGPDPGAAAALAGRTSPAAVVALVLAWDTADLRYAPGYEEALQSLYCFEPAAGCRSEEPGWGELTVVDGYLVERVFESADSAQLVLIHDVLGTVWPGGFEATAGSPAVTVTLRRLDGGWRIIAFDPPLAPHLSRTALLRRYAGVVPDSQVLARWLRER
jgi:hypothetical protein